MSCVDLHIGISHHNGTTIVTVNGDIDADSAVALRATLDQLAFERHVVVDMSNVRFMDSSGLHVLLEQTIQMSEIGGSMHVRSPSLSVRQAVERTALREILFESEDIEISS